MDFGHIAGLIVIFALKAAFCLVVWFIGCVFLVKFGLWQVARERRKYAQADLTDIDQMSGQQFEEYLEVLFERLGYQSKLTERFDKGADLLLADRGVRTAVQAKCRAHERIDVEAVRAVVASMRPYHCTRAMVVTNGYFSRPAVQTAKENNVQLWDRDYLANVLLTINNPGQPLPIPGPLAWLFNDPREVLLGPVGAASAEEDFVCATCHKQLTKGVRQYCLDQPSRFGGKVYCMDHQRQSERRLSQPTTVQVQRDVISDPSEVMQIRN
jgi:restriction system protein